MKLKARLSSMMAFFISNHLQILTILPKNQKEMPELLIWACRFTVQNETGILSRMYINKPAMN